jgi:hypothetical protein
VIPANCVTAAPRVVGQSESGRALSVPKNTGRRGLYKTMSPSYGVPLQRPFTVNAHGEPPAFWAGSILFRS